MRARVAITTLLLIGLGLIHSVWVNGHGLQSGGYGPEVKAFLGFLRREESELEFQIRNGEISRKDYVRSKNRISIHRQTVLSIVKRRGEDHVPDIHVVAASEVGQLIEDGARAMKGVKPGAVIAEKWHYLGSAVRGELFYIFERLSK